jgi:hypothetical protein
MFVKGAVGPMEFIQAMLEQLLRALLQLLLNPLNYLGVIFIVLQYRRQIALERKLFHTRLHSLLSETWRTLICGWMGGIAASIWMAFFGVTLSLEAVVLMWGISLLLMLFRVRYLCLAYSVGVMGILQSIFTAIPALQEIGFLHWLVLPALHSDIPSLLVLVAILHLVEGLLIRKEGLRLASPLFYESKRGKIVGGYFLQGFWPVPLFLLMPMSGSGLHLPWVPLISGHANIAGWGFIAFPAIIGFTEQTLSHLPKDKLRRSSGRLILYAFAVLASAGLSLLWSGFIVLASILTLIGHEALLWLSKREEINASPLFVHNRQGLKILAVLSGSVASELGLESGEIIHKVNGIRVLTKEELYQALQINSAFCKLEVINLEGQSKFVSRALYAGEHHQLGIVLCPDDEALHFVAEKPASIAAYLRKKWVGLLENKAGKNM